MAILLLVRIVHLLDPDYIIASIRTSRPPLRNGFLVYNRLHPRKARLLLNLSWLTSLRKNSLFALIVIL